MSCLFKKKLDKRKKCEKNFASVTLVNTRNLKIIKKNCNFFVDNYE